MGVPPNLSESRGQGYVSVAYVVGVLINQSASYAIYHIPDN